MADSPLPTRRAVLATLVSAEGGSPRDAGSRMWVDDTGAIVGSVTIGGCVDARVIEASMRALATGSPALLSMALGDEDAWALGMTCAGTIEVLVEPVEPVRDDPVATALRFAREAVAAGDAAVMVVPLEGAPRRLVVTARDATGTLGIAALDAAAGAEARRLLGGGPSGVRTLVAGGVTARCYFERHAPPVSLVVVGATHVAMALVRLARVLGLRTIVVDGRERFATRERFPGADEVLVGMPSEVTAHLPAGRQALFVLLAHDYKYDVPVLRSVLATDAAYVGVLGSRRRGKALLEFLAADGVPASALSRVHVPTGLDIGARTPEEIALSVLAEALAVQRGRQGGPMRDRDPA